MNTTTSIFHSACRIRPQQYTNWYELVV